MKNNRVEVMKNIYYIEAEERRKDLTKILIFGILAILVIAGASIAGIFFAKSYNEKLIAGYYVQDGNLMQRQEVENSGEEQEIAGVEEEVQEDIIEDEEEEQKNLLPVYGEEAKKRMENIYNNDTDEKVAYLTFDDGPSSNITPQILKVLEEEGVKATFFVLGSRVELYPELLRQEYEAGHYIANHSYSHEYSSVYSTPNAVLDEFNRTEVAIRQALGIENYESHLFRFPGGSEGGKYASVKKQAKELLEENGIAHINWNALTRDAEGKPTHESLVSDLKASASGKNSIVVLMHDTGTKQMTADTLPQVIAYLKEEGYTFKNFYDIMCE